MNTAKQALESLKVGYTSTMWDHIVWRISKTVWAVGEKGGSLQIKKAAGLGIEEAAAKLCQ